MAVDVAWMVSHPDITGSERARLRTTAMGASIDGVVVAVLGATPLDVRYTVEVDDAWCTRAVAVTVDSLGRRREIALARSEDGDWSVDGMSAPELAGCVDVDLGVTPSTNTLPIRRLGLEIDDEQEIAVAWVRFPELQVARGVQRYRRLGPRSWRYSSEGFAADLEVDEEGLVVEYGQGLWSRIGVWGST